MAAKFEFELVDEPHYTLGSPVNLRQYRHEVHLDREGHATSVHGVLVDGEPVIVVAASGGATAVHEHSSVRVGHAVYFAVGPHVCRFSPGTGELDWQLRVDDATCFGVYYVESHHAFIAHGELAISRFTAEGQIVWQRSGADIFTGNVSLGADYVEAVDFNDRHYHFPYDPPQA